jgi:serine acetyltransferase
VGSETIIGANAVVIDSLPSRCIAAGIPARVKVADLSDAQFREFWDSIKG